MIWLGNVAFNKANQAIRNLLEQSQPMIGHSPSTKTIPLSKITPQDNQRLSGLKRVLLLNRATQERLKATQQTIRERMAILESYISTYRIKTDYPPYTAILSYIKFQRNLSSAYKEQLRIAENTSQPKQKRKEDAEFMIKLHQEKTQKRHQLNVAELPDNPTLIDFKHISKGTQFRCGIDAFRAWLDLRRVKQPKILFNMDQDNLIKNMHQMYGQNWQKITDIVGNRSLDQIYYEYHNRINPRLTVGRWTVRQTIMLIILLEHFGPRRWAIIAKKIVVKSELQVRQRYCNLIDPSIGKDVWTIDMERRLLEVAEEYDFCWKKISLLPVFKSKTDNCVWRKYKCLMGRFTEEEIRQQLPNQQKYRGLADKIIKEKRAAQCRRRSAKNKAKTPVYYSKFRPKETQPSKDSIHALSSVQQYQMEQDQEQAYFNEKSEEFSLQR